MATLTQRTHVVEERTDRLETTLAAFMARTDESLGRLERMIERREREAARERREMNKRWGELANKWGTTTW